MPAAQLRDLVERFIGEQRRDPSPPLIEEWAGQVALGRWTYAEARRALAQWIASHPDRRRLLEPTDIAGLIRAERQDRAMRETTAQARERYAEVDAARAAAAGAPVEWPEPDEPPSTPEFRAAMFGQIAAECGWDVDAPSDPAMRDTALGIGCPHCGAPPGQFCHVLSRPDRRLAKRGAHPSRVDALAAQREAEART
jgi:hypothetical protein